MQEILNNDEMKMNIYQTKQFLNFNNNLKK